MATPDRVKNKMKELGLSGVNKPKRTPSHKTKSHVVMAKEGDQHKLIRFGQQGVKGAGKNPKTAKDKARKKSYYARHDAQGKPSTKLSAKYWSHKVKW
jgi:tRNA(Ile2) C34 agmatinyltransferase TiaS